MFALPTFFICIFRPWSVKMSNLWQPNNGFNNKPSWGCGVNEIPPALPPPKKSTKRSHSLEVFYIPLRNNLLPTAPPSAERFPTITTPLHIALALSSLATLDWKKMFRGLNWVLRRRNTSGETPSSHLWILVGNNREFIGVVIFYLNASSVSYTCWNAYLSEHLWHWFAYFGFAGFCCSDVLYR